MSLQTTSQISGQDDDGLGKRASDGKREVESLRGQRFQPAAVAGLCLGKKPSGVTPICVADRKHRSQRMIPQLCSELGQPIAV